MCCRITKHEPKSSKCAVTPYGSSECINVTMVTHLFHLFTKWHIGNLLKLILPPSKEVARLRRVTVTCDAMGEMTKEYSTFCM